MVNFSSKKWRFLGCIKVKKVSTEAQQAASSLLRFSAKLYKDSRK
jgi:hypothetical protein